MATAPPRQRLTEYFLEVELTARKHVVVEGRSDERFLRAWLRGLPGCPSVTITPVENLDIPPDVLVDSGLTDGNRSRVLVVGARAADRGVPVRCVADRDCGQNVEEFDFETVVWTDYPAIESYVVSEHVLDTANLLSFGERLPGAEVLIRGLAFALRELYAVRTHHPHLPRPNYSAGLDRRTPQLECFDVTAVVPTPLRPEIPKYQRPDAKSDPRTYAYGHDVAELLLAAFANALKNQAGLRTLEAVENALRSAIQAEGSYRDEALFRRLLAWLQPGDD
jgi:hypothetical protein